MVKIFRILVFFSFVFVGSSAVSQKKPHSHESMIWIEAIEKVQINDRFSSTLLWHHRIFIDREQTFQDIYWLDLNGRISQNFSLTGGVMYFTYRKDVQGFNLSVPEWRPFQAITYTSRIGKSKVNLRLMVEERYTKKVNEGHFMDEYHFNVRLRNRAQVFLPVTHQMQLEISEEILLRNINLGRGVFDQSRGRVRLHYYPGNGKFGFNAGYLHWLLNTSDDLEHRHSIMVGVKHRLVF